MSWWRRKKRGKSPEDENEARRQATYAARDAYKNTLGTVSPDVVAPAINPAFQGGPMWPDLRQAYAVIQRGGRTVIMSDGLSDPFSDDPEPNAGFELEVLGETEDAIDNPHSANWLLELVMLVSQQCADHGGVRSIVEQLGVVSMELPEWQLLGDVATPNGTAGVLLGVPPDYPQEFDLPGGGVRIVTVKLLWPSELEFVVAEGDAGRAELARRFAEDGTHHRSSLKRKPVA